MEKIYITIEVEPALLCEMGLRLVALECLADPDYVTLISEGLKATYKLETLEAILKHYSEYDTPERAREIEQELGPKLQEAVGYAVDVGAPVLDAIDSVQELLRLADGMRKQRNEMQTQRRWMGF